ncbi:MAG: adenylate/guanylate cyclase domain-containing protein [Myxococcales bacterium]
MTLSQTLASYLPRMVVDFVARRPRTEAADAAEQLFPAAVMLADVSGFTRLAERLQQQGPAGAESLTRILNAYFTPLIERIHARGGDVVKFAGDAMMVLWPATSPADLGPCVRAAALCGLELQDWSRHGQTAPADEQLSLKVSISAGTMRLCHVGGVAGRWELLVTGEPLAALNHVTHGAQPGRVLVTLDVAQRLPGAHLAKSGEGDSSFLDALPDPVAASSPATIPDAAPAGIEDGLRAYLPRAVLDRLDQASFLSELRTATVMFVNFPNATYQTPLARAHLIAQLLQSTLDKHEGTLNKLSVDEKGVSMVAAFGLPPRVHEDDPARAVATALSLHEELARLSVVHAIGLTTGRVFSGVVGSPERREYTVMGDSVNLAARLMQAAKGDVLADEATASAARSRATFEAVPPLTVKGKSEPIPAFRPTALVQRSVAAAAAASGAPTMIGREAERARAAAALSALEDASARSGLLLVEGEAGIGKSVFVAQIRADAGQRGLRTVVGWGDAVESASPYFAFRAALKDLAGPGSLDERRARLLDLLDGDSAALALAPLLNAVVPLGLPETPFITEMAGALRADNTRDLLLRLFAGAARRARTVVLLEDAHWLDSASLALVLALHRQVRPLLLIVSTRPVPDPAPPELPRARRRRRAEPPRARAALWRADDQPRLPPPGRRRAAAPGRPPHPGARRRPPVLQRGAGLRASRLGGVEDRRAPLRELAGGADALLGAGLPETVQGIISSRVDRLPPAEQLTLKAASVVGRVFGLDVLEAIHPQQPERAPLSDQLSRLEKLDLTPLDSPVPVPTYLFKHVVTHQVVYDLMLFSQRAELHGQAARWYEENRAQELAAHAPLLAHHWSRAGDPAKTLGYLEKAGEQALQSGAYAEARRFLAEADRLDRENPSLLAGREASLRRARRQRLRGDAELCLGNLAESRAHLLESVRLLGSPLPASRLRWAMALAGHALRQLAQRLLRRPPEADAFRRECANEAAQAYERLGPVCIFFNLPPDALFCSLAGTNLAGRVGPSGVLAKAFANFAIGLSVAPLPALAERYARLALSQLGPATPVGAEAWVQEMVALFCTGAGRWDEAVAGFRRGAQLHQTLGDRRRQEECELILAVIGHLRGDLAGSLASAREVAETAGRREDRHMLGGSGAMVGLSLHRLGRFDEAAATAEQAAGNARQVRARPELIWALGVQSAAELARGERERALAAAQEAVRTMAGLMPTAAWVLEGYACTAETLLRLASERPELDGLAREAFAGVERCARSFPWLRARRAYLEGLRADLAGDREKGTRHHLRAVTAAQALGSLVDEALALQAIVLLPRPERPLAAPLAAPDRRERLREIERRTGLVLPLDPALAGSRDQAIS